MAAASDVSLFYPQIIQLKESVKPVDLSTSDIDSILLDKIKAKIGGKCIKQGYVDKNSIKILKRSVGKINSSHFNGEVYYDIQVEASICLPAEGNRIKTKVAGKNKSGILCVAEPLQIIIPMDFIEGMFDSINKDDMIIVEIRRVRWELDQKFINAIGSFVAKA